MTVPNIYHLTLPAAVASLARWRLGGAHYLPAANICDCPAMGPQSWGLADDATASDVAPAWARHMYHGPTADWRLRREHVAWSVRWLPAVLANRQQSVHHKWHIHAKL